MCQWPCDNSHLTLSGTMSGTKSVSANKLKNSVENLEHDYGSNLRRVSLFPELEFDSSCSQISAQCESEEKGGQHATPRKKGCHNQGTITASLMLNVLLMFSSLFLL